MSEKYFEFGDSNVRQDDTTGSSISNVVELRLRGRENYDPLQDEEVLNMLRDYYKSGVAVLFGKDVACYEKHRDAISRLSDEEAGELGLKAPCYFIRSPATEVTQKVDEIRYSLGPWENRVTNVIVGAWLFGRRVDQELLERLMPDTNFNKVLSRLAKHKLITVEPDYRVKPTRILLYRVVEQVAWLIDTIAPLVYKFCSPGLAGKMAYWPPFEEGIP